MSELTPFTREHLEGALALFAAEGWQTYTADPERTYRALAAPGCTTLVAVDGATVIALVLGAARKAGFRLTREDLGLSVSPP